MFSELASGQESGQGAIEGRVFNQRSGRYLSQAEVSIDGTSIRVFTNPFGEYLIYNAPSGPQTLRANFTGLQEQVARVMVEPGGTVSKDFNFIRRRSEGTDTEPVFELEEFVVSSNDFQGFQEIAIQEERFSTNLKNVVAADAYGTIAQGNIGEFVKFIPGVQVDYGGTYSSGADAASIRVRGFSADQTAVTIDGMPVSNAQPGSLTRAIGLDMLSINNASRVEVIKVPTPDQPNVGIGGTVNLISKNAFEYPKPTLKYRVYFALNSENLDFFKKTPGPMNKKTYKALPGIDLTYALPLNDKFGFTFTVASANQFNENHTAKLSYVQSSSLKLPLFIKEDGTRIEPVYADIAHPYLNNMGITDGPRVSHRHSAAIKMDYRPWDGHLISMNYQVSIFESADARRRFELYTGGSSGIAAYGPDFLETQSGRAIPEQNVTALDKEGITQSAYVKWEYVKGPWNVRSHYSFSRSDGEFISAKNGHFSELQLEMGGIESVYVSDMQIGFPRTIVYHDKDGNEIDGNALSSYTVSGYVEDDPSASRLRVLAGQTFSKSEFHTAKFDIRRELDFLPLANWMQFALKGGIYYEDRLEEKWGRGTGYGYEYLGESGVELNIGDFVDKGYLGVSPGFGFPPREWPDLYKVYKYYKDNPEGFSDTHDMPRYYERDGDGRVNDLLKASVAAENYSSWVNSQKAVTETRLSWYWQVEGDFFNNRLSVVGGIRQSRADRTGRSPLRDHDWKFLREEKDLNGDGIMEYPILNLGRGSLNISEQVPAEDAEAFEAAGAVYGDGTPFHAADADLILIDPPRGADYYVRGTRIGPGDEDIMGYAPSGTLRARQLEYIPNFKVNETAKDKPSPIISSSFDLTDKIVLRASWSQTFAPADFEGSYGVLQKVSYDQDQDGPGGTIEVGNPALKPWESTNWDFGIAYYTDSGGQIGVNYYTKSIVDFHIKEEFGPEDEGYLEELAEVGFGPDSIYARDGWYIEKPINGEGSAKTDGYELEARHDLSIFGNWGKTLYLYGSYTVQNKSENQNNVNDVGFGNNTTKFASGGLSWRWSRYSVQMNATWKPADYGGSRGYILWPDPSVGDPTPDGPEEDDDQYRVIGYSYTPEEIKVDLSVAIRLWKNHAIDFSARNITNVVSERIFKTVDGSYPKYARARNFSDYGFNFTVGFSGSF